MPNTKHLDDARRLITDALESLGEHIHSTEISTCENELKIMAELVNIKQYLHERHSGIYKPRFQT